MPLDSNTRYNANIFALPSKRDNIFLRQDSGTVPSPHQNYKVFNIGRTRIFVELLFGKGIEWCGLLDSYTVEPGQTRILDNKGKNYIKTAIRVSNLTNERAIFHASTADGEFPMVVAKEQGVHDYEYYQKLKELFCVGTNHVPCLTKKFQGLLDAFWPRSEPNIWEQIELKLEPLLEYHILDRVRGFLDSFINDIGDRIRKINVEFEQGRPVDDYMNIVEDLKGFEKQFIYEGSFHYHKAMTKFLLPLYSNFVLMKITFYTLGITCCDELGLTKNHLNYIKEQINVTIKGKTGATSHVDDMLNEWVHIVYDTCHPEEIYNSMMNNRSLIGLLGIEYSRIWEHMASNPGKKVHNNVISYSTFFGRPTANLYRQALIEQMEPPLTHHFHIRSVDIYLWRKSPISSPKIGGAKLIFENDDEHVMGTVTEEVERIDLNGECILKITVTGDGGVDSCVFYMSDNRELSFGTTESEGFEETFEMRDHHIVSFFVSSDNFALEGQAANIAVAYRLNDEYIQRCML